jgi:MoaA/NifB/PqqE/SkfB family radical SAM enzyme
MAVYNYNGKEPNKISVDDLTESQKSLLFENPSFCMYPWLHLHAFPTGEAYPCCNTEMQDTIGNTREQSLEEIWSGPKMKAVRHKMLAGEKVSGCTRCYEQEDSGFFSMRLSANKHFGHHIGLTNTDNPDMKLIYWDIRFSNLCNLRCRSCGHIFSSNWYDDQVKLAGEEWGKNNKRVNFAGRSEHDIWQQLEPQIDNIEQVYFAGGEPLIMEEHYRLLSALIDRGRTDVRLIYNTNFSELCYKKTNVLELWKQFDSVSVGASLDAMGKKAEYIRKNTKWDQVERNRTEMLKVCPGVDFYISATLSIMNVHHLPVFHKDWVSKGFIQPQDFNINILQDPAHYRIDVLPLDMKKVINHDYQQHIEWLRPLDHLRRATTGYESAVKFMMASDKSNLIPVFKNKTAQLDSMRNESLAEALPELANL